MLVSTKMITGFNTDVPHGGQVYHVQTEDRGKDNPILESLVYIGGTIVAKKRTPYPATPNEKASQDGIASLLKRQHQVIIAAIKAGRIEDLIRHSVKQETGSEPDEKESNELLPVNLPKGAGGQIEAADRRHLASKASPQDGGLKDNGGVVSPERAAASLKPAGPSDRRPAAPKAGAPVSPPRRETAGLNLDQVLEDYEKRGAGQSKLDVKVLTPEVFTAGKGIGLRVQVTQGAKPHFDATVTVKIIGTAFKPQVFIGRVGRDGVASFSLTLPSFTTGTAAIVIEAQSGSGRGELKNLIRRA